jgi:hypothetical protein
MTMALSTTTTTTTTRNWLSGERSQYSDAPEIKTWWRRDFPCP